MAQTTANYGLLKPESTDTYNHLVYDNPNMDTIDGAMKDNADHAIDSATCIKTGTVHAVVRSNTSAPVFKFTATGDWNTGDSMTVDGNPVSVFLPNGSAPLTGCYVINTEVIAAIAGSRVTLMCPVIPDASNIPFDNTGTTLSATDVEAALQELNSSANIAYDANSSVEDMFSYSNTERVCGKWIDGKPLYEKTIACGALPNNTTKNVPHGISNIKIVASMVGVATRTFDRVCLPIPFANTAGTVCMFSTNVTNIVIISNADLSAQDETYITLRYTKTTD